MITELINLYDRLVADNDKNLAPKGYSSQKISFAVVLNPDGSLHAIEDRTEPNPNKKGSHPVPMIVLGQTKSSGSGLNPCLLWDTAGYLLGIKDKDDNPERTRLAHEAFKTKHLSIEAEINSPEFSAVCRFLESWSPNGQKPQTGNGVFQIRGQTRYVHETPQVRAYWDRQLASNEGRPDSISIISGEPVKCARLHEPKIKGIYGAQSSGAKIVSYNSDAHESYGNEQGDNAPIGTYEAFRYCTALNWLLASNAQCLDIAGVTTVFWTEKQSEAESFLGMILDPKSQDDSLLARINSILDTLSQGRFPSELGDPSTFYYVAGLSSASARIALRFWYVNTLGHLCKTVGDHFAGLTIERQWKNQQPYPSLLTLLRQCIRGNGKIKEIPNTFSADLLRSIIYGAKYPLAFYAAVLLRSQIEYEVNHPKAAIIKAILKRNYNTILPMSLDPTITEPAYLLGRLFAVLEHIQRAAHTGRNLNKSIKDGFFGTAARTPAQAFPQLIQRSVHHLNQLRAVQ